MTATNLTDDHAKVSENETAVGDIMQGGTPSCFYFE